MGLKQTTFLVEFADAFRERFGREVKLSGGQALENTASLVTHFRPATRWRQDLELRQSSIRTAIHWIATTVQASPIK